MRIAAILAGMALAHAVLAQDPATGASEVAWAAQQAGELKWAHVVVPDHFSRCGGAAILAAQERDPTLEAQMQTDVSGYSCYRFGVRNDSGRRIQCQVRFEQLYGTQKKPASMESGIVLDPDTQDVAMESFAMTSAVPRAVSSKCFEIPAELPPYKQRPECRGQLNAPSPARFYPAGSRHRMEEGNVIIEYGVIKGSGQLKDVRVVASSGFAGLDTAALQVAAESQATHKCANVRYRGRIVFKLADSDASDIFGN
jgi:TonB family protein